MPTLELREALDAVEKAQRCVLDCNRELVQAQRRRDEALTHQREYENEKTRLEIGLNPGQQRFVGRTVREPNAQELEAMRYRLRELELILQGAPAQRRGRLY